MMNLTRILLPLVVLMGLASCIGNDFSLVEKARGLGLTIEDAEAGAVVFAAVDNKAGNICYGYIAAKMAQIKSVDELLPKPEDRGPLTRFAIFHSGVEVIGAIRAKGNNDFNLYCGALMLQVDGNVQGFWGLLRRLVRLP